MSKIFVHTDQIAKYVFKEELELEFEIIHLKSLFTNAAEFIFKPHRTNFYHIIWLTEGKSFHMLDFNSIEIQQHQFLTIGTEMVHQFDHNTEYDGYLIVFTDNFFCTTIENTKFLQSCSLFDSSSPMQSVHAGKYIHIFQQLISSIQFELNKKNSTNSTQIIQNYLYNFLLYLEEVKNINTPVESLKNKESTEMVSKFKKLVNQFFTTQKQVSFYIDALRTNEKRLNKSVQEITGKTTKKIIKERIILEIKRLLAHSNNSIKEISYQLGFEEPTNFIKFFKKSENMTPFDFRKKFK